MFLVAQLILKKLRVCKPDTIPIYSIVVGLVFYATIFLYLLYKESEYASFFNKFAIYIIGTDLLLSALVHYSTNTNTNTNSFNMQNNESDNDTASDDDDDGDGDIDDEINSEGQGESEREELIENAVNIDYVEVIPPIESSMSPIPEETPEDLVEKADTEEDLIELPEIVVPKKRGRPPNPPKAV